MRMILGVLLVAWTVQAEQTNSLYSRVFDVTNHEGTVFKDARILKLDSDFATVVCTKGVGGGRVYVTNLPPVIRAELAGLAAVKRTETPKGDPEVDSTTDPKTGRRTDVARYLWQTPSLDVFMSLTRHSGPRVETYFTLGLFLKSGERHGMAGNSLALIADEQWIVPRGYAGPDDAKTTDGEVKEFQLYEIEPGDLRQLSAASQIEVKLLGARKVEALDFMGAKRTFQLFWKYIYEHPVASFLAGSRIVEAGDSVIGPASMRVIETNDTWWRIAYKFTVRNPSTSLRTHSFEVQFKERDGFVVKDQTEYNVEIPAGQTKEVSGYALIKTGPAATVTKVEVQRK